jgi:hypothetical protein
MRIAMLDDYQDVATSFVDWDVIQDEVTAEESKRGLPMFGDTFPTRT